MLHLKWDKYDQQGPEMIPQDMYDEEMSKSIYTQGELIARLDVRRTNSDTVKGKHKIHLKNQAYRMLMLIKAFKHKQVLKKKEILEAADLTSESFSERWYPEWYQAAILERVARGKYQFNRYAAVAYVKSIIQIKE
jgi:hypothetical protein